MSNSRSQFHVLQTGFAHFKSPSFVVAKDHVGLANFLLVDLFGQPTELAAWKVWVLPANQPAMYLLRQGAHGGFKCVRGWLRDDHIYVV